MNPENMHLSPELASLAMEAAVFNYDMNEKQIIQEIRAEAEKLHSRHAIRVCCLSFDCFYLMQWWVNNTPDGIKTDFNFYVFMDSIIHRIAGAVIDPIWDANMAYGAGWVSKDDFIERCEAVTRQLHAEHLVDLTLPIVIAPDERVVGSPLFHFTDTTIRLYYAKASASRWFNKVML